MRRPDREASVAERDDTLPDLTRGVAFDALHEGSSLAGRVGDDDVLLVKSGADIFAVGAHCTHYHGPLADGLVVGDTVRCPWHHACFSLRTGEAVRAPALDAIACWRVERAGGKVFVKERIASQDARAASPTSGRGRPESVVIVGGGAAGLAAADMLRREGYDGAVTLVSADEAPPCDRPNLSKDYLAGTAQEDWIPLRSPDWYKERRINLLLDTSVSAIDVQARRAALSGGRHLEYGALLLATGAAPVKLDLPGADRARIHYLRTFADSRAIVASAASAKKAVVIGGSFIGLEVAASLATRGLGVCVVAPESVPLERVLGVEVGRFVRAVHEAHGVVFHLGRTVGRVDGRQVTLDDGTALEADFVVVGVGVRPAIGLAEGAGLALDRGIAVNEYLETSAKDVYAAGDIARWPDPHTGTRIRVEHWVVAQRQGQVAARNILGRRERFDAVPFFWSQHYDVAINYVGHAEQWDAIEIEGSIDERNCRISYRHGGRTLAVATVSRDLESLRAECSLEQAAA
jgi:NADPH-dependent 2,4-dienoyl-CoA reductase/sulfur reductase-like enzyme/nitrite reductase/ring-hydroxylating ferredoxin subunit